MADSLVFFLIFHTINFLMSVRFFSSSSVMGKLFSLPGYSHKHLSKRANEVWGVIINGQELQKTNFGIII